VKMEKLRKLKQKVRHIDIACSISGMIGLLLGVIEVLLLLV